MIYGFNVIDTIQLLDGTTVSKVSKSGNDIVLKIGSGSIILKDSANTSSRYSMLNKPIRFIDQDENLSALVFNGTSTVGVDIQIADYDNLNINGTTGNDAIEIINDYSPTITAGKGNDTIYHVGSYENKATYSYASGDGNDVIYNLYSNYYGYSSFYGMIDITSGSVSSYSINSSGDEILKIGSGSITIKNDTSEKINNFIVRSKNSDGSYKYTKYYYGTEFNEVRNGVTGTSGNDWFGDYNHVSNELIETGAGNDLVSLSGSSGNTIVGGTGNDSIYAGNDYLIQYSKGDGNDKIYYDFQVADNSTATVKLLNGATITDFSADKFYKSRYYERSVTFKIGSNTIDFYPLYSDRASWLRATKGGTEINFGNSFRFNNYEGNLIEGTTSDDIILNLNEKHKYDDSGSIYITDTISAGVGNDSIYLGNYRWHEYPGLANVVEYGSGDGKDVIFGYDHKSAIHLTDGAKISKVSLSGSDIILTVGSGSITIKDSENQIVNLQDDNGSISSFYVNGTSTIKAIANYESEKLVTGTSSAEYIYNGRYDSTIDAGAGNDTIYNASSYISINAGAGNDSIYSHNDIWCSTINGGTGNDTIIINKESSWDGSDNHIVYKAGDGNDIVSVESGIYNNWIFDLATGTSVTGFKKNGNDFVFNLTGGGSFTLKNVDTYSTVPKIKFRSVSSNGKETITRWIDGKSYNQVINPTVNYDESTKVFNGTAKNDYIFSNAWGEDITIDAKDGDDFINDHQAVSASLIGGKGNDTIVVGSFDSRYYSGYKNAMIDGGVGNDSIQVKMGRYWYWDDGTNESYELYSQASVNGGADDDVIEIEAYNTTTKGSWEWDEDTGKEIWNAGTGIEDISGIVTVKAGAGNDTIRNKFLYKYEDGHTYFNDSDYYDPSIYEDYDGKPYKVSRTVTSYFKTPTTYTTVITWKMSDGTSKTSSITSNLIYNRLIQSYTATDGVVTIDASERTKVVKITGNDEDNVIIGGSKNDTFIGKGGNDTFVSDAGKDFVTDYEVGDFVSLTGDISKVAASGNNVTLTSNKGSIVLNGAKGKKVTFIDGSGNVTKQTFGVNKLNIVDGDGSTINVANDATVITLDASDRTEDIILIGNAKANT
ncbi:MAG: calcium-binding protein, partial [Selenomonadaceae bacterium]|nr:calcium-binding protein [Selenomonadaceae bacterium]